MMSPANALNQPKSTRRISLLLVSLMLSSVLVSLAPTAIASHEKTYHTQKNPTTIAAGDLDCDGDDDLVTGSEMGNFLTILYNDNGDFSDRQDIWTVNNNSRRAGFEDIADASEVEIGDIDGDSSPDIVYFQGNIRTVNGPGVMGNLTILYGDCTGSWTESQPITISPYMIGIEVADVDNDGNDDIVALTLDYSIVNMQLAIYRGPDPNQVTNQATTTMPLGGTSGAYYYDFTLGSYGETVAGGGIGGGIGDCEDLDAWLMTSPPYNGPQAGFDPGNWDNVTTIEYDCTANTFYNPNTNPNNVHKFAMGTTNDGYLDVADTDSDGHVDLVAMTDGWDQNVTYATKNGANWVTGNYAYIGNAVGSSVSIEDINQDGSVDFVVPSLFTVTTVTSTALGNTTLLSTDNLQDQNTVQIILSDGSGGWESPQSFDVGRRPTMAIVGQLAGGAGSALDIAVGQRDYTFSYTDGSLWIDSKGWAGSVDSVTIVELDNQDVGVTGLSVSPAAYNPFTQSGQLGEGTRNVNVTVRNTGLETVSGSADVEVKVRDILSGTDTVVYSNDFDGNVDTSNCTGCSLDSTSYTGEWGSGSSWHVESSSNTSNKADTQYEAHDNPTGFMWAGLRYANSSDGGNLETGYLNNMDEAFFIENIDLTNSDTAALDIDMLCAVSYSMVYYSSTGIANRVLYDDVCTIDVWSQADGWQTVNYMGGHDNDRILYIQNGYAPERAVNNNRYYLGTIYDWNNYTGEDAIDLTPWAGEIIDLRFRFRTGFSGSVGTSDEVNQTQWDGFAFDNISIRKTVSSFGANPQVSSQSLTLTNFAPGDEEVVSLSANFINGTTYLIETSITNTNGFTNGDATNDDAKFSTLVSNLFDPATSEITSLQKGALYAADTYPIDVKVENRGNTVTDFEVIAKVYTAQSTELLSEDFETGSGGFQFGDDGDNYGVVIDDTAPSVQNSLVPQNRPVFEGGAYWFGGPDDGYGTDWNETINLATIDLTNMQGDFAYMNFDYFAEMEVLEDAEGNVVGWTAETGLEAEWRQGSNIYQGTIYGSWNDINENGVLNNQSCEDIDGDGYLDEIETFGDRPEDGNYAVWFDSEGLKKSVTLDLTHVYLLNTTSADSSQWRRECATFSEFEVDFTWRFQSDPNGADGSNGLAGFGLDNISVTEFTFVPDQEYSTTVTGLDSQEDQIVTVGNHAFTQGIYRVDAISVFDNTTQGTAWYGFEELLLSNNLTRIVFNVASVDVLLRAPDVLSCVEESIPCSYPIDSVRGHDFNIEMTNGVLAGDYNIKMDIVDMSTGNSVSSGSGFTSVDGLISLEPQQAANTSWINPYNGWEDGKTYNLSFYAELADGTISGNTHYYHITFEDNIDVAILSGPTDANRLKTVREDLQAMGMSYTQFKPEDWSTYATDDWLSHYDKVLLPWQTENNVLNGQYYSQLDTSYNGNPSVKDTLLTFMNSGGTVQMHLGPYSDGPHNAYLNNKLPFGIDVVDRDTLQAPAVRYQDMTILDSYHPIMSNVAPSSFVGVNSGNFVSQAVINIGQTGNDQMPYVCGGEINQPRPGFNTAFHTLIEGPDADMSLLATCGYGAGGLIVSTIDVENPSVTNPFGDTTFPILSNLLSHKVTPYSSSFGYDTNGPDGWNMLIDGQVPDWDIQSWDYSKMYLKSNAQLTFSFESTLSGLDANWEIKSGDSFDVTKWGNDGQTLPAGAIDHTADDTHTATFCVLDTSSATNCKTDASWIVTLFLHDAEGHVRKANIELVTNDVQADSERPVAHASVVDRLDTADYITQLDDYEVNGVQWMFYRITCPGKSTDPCERRVYFDASQSSDNDSTDGTSGIISYEWRIYSDRRYDQLPSGSPYHEYVRSTSDFTYAFKNVTADPTGNTAGTPIRMDLTVQDRANKDSEKYRLFFQIVPEDFGDAPPVVDILTPEEGDSQSGALVWINGTVSSGVEDDDLFIQVALSGTDLNLTPTQQFNRKGAMKFNSTSALGDGSNFQLALSIDDLYQVGEGVTQTVYIKIYEGNDGVAIYQQIQINLIPIDEVDNGGGETNTELENTEGAQDSNLLLIVAGLIFALVAIVGVTLLVMRSRGGSDASSGGEQAVFGGVETMDPKEAYVQQLIAQGYPEETARAYAEQYASHFQQ
ncbi:MAG: hypothetical protein CMB72_02635 [Euryarchaeota archaeon]|nr:hypothetical protein [Euryarchaeota archaeon]